MDIETSIPLLEEILGKWKKELCNDETGYKNHVYRMINFCFALHECTEEEREKIIIAGAFHDLGIWSKGTLDYLPPSIDLAKEYLEQNGREAWIPEIELMIDMHHKVRKYSDDRYPLVEVFRKADLVDVSMGSVTAGLSKSYIKDVRDWFPNAGFHKRLGELAWAWFVKHPLSLPPFLKW